MAEAVRQAVEDSEIRPQGAGRIADLSVFKIEVPVVSKRSHGVGDVSGGMRNVILKLRTEDGLTGWGEASPWPVFTGTAEGNAAALDVHLRPLLIGAYPSRINEIMAAADRIVVGHSEAKAALEMALYDILGKRVGLPVAELLGGRCRDDLPLSVSLADPDFAADIDLMQRIYADGVRIVKLKTGFADHAFDIMRLETLRADFPDDLRIRVDYNQGMVPHEALRRLRDVEAFAPDFLEQPVPAKEWQAMAHYTAMLDTPIMADESVFSVADAVRAVGARIADQFSVKIMKCGGMRRGQEIAAAAAGGGIACYGGDMFETGLAHLAGVHLVASTPNISLGCEFYQASYYVERDLLAAPFPVRDGKVVVPTALGLGIDVDEGRLADFAAKF